MQTDPRLHRLPGAIAEPLWEHITHLSHKFDMGAGTPRRGGRRIGVVGYATVLCERLCWDGRKVRKFNRRV